MILKSRKTNSGHALVEVVLASAILALLSTVFTYALIYGQEAAVISSRQARAVFLAEEGMQAVKSIAAEDFASLPVGDYSLVLNNNTWELATSEESIDVFVRKIHISNIDANTKEVSSEITWQQNLQREGNFILKTRIVNWR